MAIYKRGDTVWVWSIWETDGKINQKERPGIIYDIIGEDYYSILVYGTDRTGVIPGFKIKYQSKEGKKMRLTKDSFINVSKFVPLRKTDIIKLMGFCPDEILDKIENVANEFGIEKP